MVHLYNEVLRTEGTLGCSHIENHFNPAQIQGQTPLIDPHRQK
jgi:hypothetical protein